MHFQEAAPRAVDDSDVSCFPAATATAYDSGGDSLGNNEEPKTGSCDSSGSFMPEKRRNEPNDANPSDNTKQVEGVLKSLLGGSLCLFRYLRCMEIGNIPKWKDEQTKESVEAALRLKLRI